MSMSLGFAIGDVAVARPRSRWFGGDRYHGVATRRTNLRIPDPTNEPTSTGVSPRHVVDD